MNVHYCRRWNFSLDQPIDPYTPEQARERDEQGELYTVIIGDAQKPECVIERDGSLYGPYFFDSNRRRQTCFAFRAIDDKRLFLKEIWTWEYPHDKARRLNESSRIDHLVYDQNGIVKHTITDKIKNEVVTRQIADVKLDINWEPVPEFGDWESLSRFNRDKPHSEGLN